MVFSQSWICGLIKDDGKCQHRIMQGFKNAWSMWLIQYFPPIVPPSVSLQTYLWKCRSTERPSHPTSVRLSLSLCLFISSLHLSQNPSTNNSGGLSSSFRASLRSSVCLHARPRRVVIGLPVCLLVCIYVVPVRSLCVCDITNISCNYNESH